MPLTDAERRAFTLLRARRASKPPLNEQKLKTTSDLQCFAYESSECQRFPPSRQRHEDSSVQSFPTISKDGMIAFKTFNPGSENPTSVNPSDEVSSTISKRTKSEARVPGSKPVSHSYSHSSPPLAIQIQQRAEAARNQRLCESEHPILEVNQEDGVDSGSEDSLTTCTSPCTDRSDSSAPGSRESSSPSSLGSRSSCTQSDYSSVSISTSAVSHSSRKRKRDAADIPLSNRVTRAARKAEINLQTAELKNLGRGQISDTPRAIHNYQDACYQNAALHVLSEVPELSELKLPSNEEFKPRVSPSALDMKKAAHSTGPARRNMRACVRAAAVENTIKLAPYFKETMIQLSAESSTPVYSQVFNMVCGEMIGSEFDGETQEDVREFIDTLLQKLQIELPEIEIESLFRPVFEERRVCKSCGNVKTYTSHEVEVQVAPQLQTTMETISLKDLIYDSLRDASNFQRLRCDGQGCGGQDWVEVQGWTGVASKRLSVIPPYLMIHIPRESWRQTENKRRDGTIEVNFTPIKIKTNILLPQAPIKMCTVNGKAVTYELVAAIEHEGRTTEGGHYTAIRKFGKEWYHCDDSNLGGIKHMTPDDLTEHGKAKLCLFRKVSGP